MRRASAIWDKRSIFVFRDCRGMSAQAKGEVTKRKSRNFDESGKVWIIWK